MADENANTPVPGSDEYNEAMAAKARDARESTPENQDVDTPSVTPMPENGLEKFYNKETGVYDWQNHAKELEYRLANNGKDAKAPDDAKSDNGKLKLNEDAQDIISAAGLNVEALETAIRDTGELPDGAKDALIKQGIPESLIDSYVGLAKEAVANAEKSAMDYVGGEDTWTAVNEWSQANLSEGEKKMYNEMLAGENWQVAVDVLKQKMISAGALGKEGKLITGDLSGTPTATGYQSRAEMRADMKKPEYQTDPAFRKKVMDKMAVSTYPADQY